MNEEKTAQTNKAMEDAGASDAVGHDAETDTTGPAAEANDATFSDNDAGNDGSDADEEKQRARERNAQNARRRREAEARQKELADARVNAIIEAVGENPFTGEELKDSSDVEEYLAMKEIQRAGGDPLRDFAKHRKDKERKAREDAEREEQEKAWYRSDGEAFAAKYPDVDLNALVADPQFAEYADGKVGKKPLSEIYEGYQKLSEDLRKKADERAAQAIANSRATPGALSSTKAPEGNFFTREQVQAMSQAEVKKHYDDIRRSMKSWQ